MKTKKKLMLSLNKKKVSSLNRSLQDQILGGTSASYGCGNGPNYTNDGGFGCAGPTLGVCQSGYQCSMSCGN